MTATRNRPPARTRPRPAAAARRPAPARARVRTGDRPPGGSPPRRRPNPPRGYSPRRRLLSVLVVMLLAFGAIVVRLAQVQAFDAGRYAALGESQRVRLVQLPAERGSIFDRNGQDLALSMPQTTIWANPREVLDPRAQAEALAPLLAKDVAVVEAELRRDGSFVYLARKVDDQTASRVTGLDQPGIYALKESKRFLPAGNLATSLLGKVGLDNEGLSGLEIQFERRLSGKAGRLVVERDPSGRKIAGGVREHVASERGDDLVLTIDRALQYETERALAAEIATANARGGIAIVMETRTGEVLSMANLSRDLETGVIEPSAQNAALTNVYEPGSVNKLITIAGALEKGLIQPHDELLVPYTYKIGPKVFKEHDPHPTEKWSITDIMANSSNVGSIMIAQKLGKQGLHDFLSGFGFGKTSGLKFPGESAGLLRDWSKWYSTDMGSVPIGHGVSVTPMQMVAAYNTIANGGVYVAPKLVRSTIDAKGEEHPTAPAAIRRVVSETTAREVTAMLNEVVRVGTGTRAAIRGYTVAGKTGTARKPSEDTRGYKTGAYVSSFAGFVPAERPAFTAIVMLDEPTPIFGGIVAAPVFAQIAQYGLRELRIPPPPPTAVAKVPESNPADARAVGEITADSATTLPPTPPRKP